MPKSFEQSIELHRSNIARAIDAASYRRLKNDSGGELVCLAGALQSSLCVAVSQYSAPRSGIEYLQTEFKPSIFDRLLELVRNLSLNASAGRDDSGTPGVFKLVLSVHAAWLLELFGEAKELAAFLADERRKRLYRSSALWSDYVRGLAAVAQAGKFTPQDRRYKGYDRHWAAYLQLMADISNGDNLLSAVAAVDRSFSLRNGDKRLLGDGLDGDGLFPVKWDFRKHSLLLAAEHNSAQGIEGVTRRDDS